MARPRKSETMETVSVRIPTAMSTEIDAYMEELQIAMPLLPISRTDAVRQLLALALEARKKGKKRKA
jgi:hypothetical protein